MQIRPFSLERYFARHEFSARYLLGSSDPESMSVRDLLALEPDAEPRLQDLWLGYTESSGAPELRRAIARLYTATGEDDILVFSGAQEPIFAFMNVALAPGDHMVAHAPGYQSHYEVARAVGAEISLWSGDPGRGFALDPDDLRRLLRPSTKVILVGSPHNPTGFHFPRSTWDEVVHIAQSHGAWLFSDEVYRGLEHDPADRLPPACDLYERGVSLNGLSKSYALAGLRIGWIATRDRDLLARLAAFKDYLTISNSAPSELLAAVAVRSSEQLFARSRERLVRNAAALDAFVGRHASWFEWQRPRAGSTAFVRFLGGSAEAFCDALVRETGILLVPSTHFEWGDDHLRFGYGRADLAKALDLLAGYLAEGARQRPGGRS